MLARATYTSVEMDVEMFEKFTLGITTLDDIIATASSSLAADTIPEQVLIDGASLVSDLDRMVEAFGERIVIDPEPVLETATTTEETIDITDEEEVAEIATSTDEAETE